ncbi:MAG: DMT family transporter [Rhodovibrionaceae bacterium]|nr:DMT family transporter [Rhodovibrionaceae bacterium]
MSLFDRLPRPARRAGRQRLSALWLRLPGNTRGALWMVAAASAFACNAALIKWLTAMQVPPFQIVFARSLIGLLIVLPFIWPDGTAALRTRHAGVHILRGLFGAGAMLAGYLAISLLPLAEVTALTFTQPLFTLVLAVLLLSERVRWRRWTATAVGFLGVLIMVRPGAAAFQPESLLALASAFGIAMAVILVKRLPAGERHSTMLFYFGVVATLVTAGPAIAVWQTPTWAQAGIMVLIGLMGMASQAAIIRAYRAGEAAYVAPFDYSKLILATLLGVIAFGEVPGIWTFLGAAVIVGSTLYISRRESRQRRSRTLGDGGAPAA